MAISFVGSATGTNSIASMPAHQAGDMLVFFAYRDGSTTLPTLPGDCTNITNNGGGTINGCARIAYKIADSNTEASDVWTGATSLVCLVYRPGTGETLSVGASASATNTNGTASIPAVTLQNSDGTSWVVAGVGINLYDSSDLPASNPSGMIRRVGVADATDEAAGYDTNGGVTSFTAKSISLGDNDRWVGLSFELKVAASEVTLTAGNSDQINESSSAAITQNHALTAGNSDQVNESSASAISQTHVLTSGNADQINESSSSAVSQVHVLTGGDSDQINESYSGAITQEQTLTSGDADQVNESSGASISQEHVLTAGNSDQINEVSAGAIDLTLTLLAGNSDQINESSSGAISQEHVLVAGDVDQLNESSSGAITQEQTLIAGDVEQVNEVSDGSITNIHVLAAGDTDQVNESASAAITQEHVLSVGDADQVNESSAGSIEQEHFLTSGDADQINEVSDGAIAFTITLESGDSDQINESSGSAITQTHLLVAGNADQINEITGGSVGVINLVAGDIDQINTVTAREIRLEEILNLQMLYKNDFDSASVAATSSASGYALSNTTINNKSSVWRSTSLSEQTISGDWGGTAKDISGLALAFSNLIEGSTVRLKLYQEVADTLPSYDSGVRTVWFAYDPPDGFETIGLISFAFGGGTNFSMFFNEVAVKRFEIIVTSSGNADGYIEIGRVILGKAWSPTYNAEYGAQITPIDLSQISRTVGGDQKVDVRTMHKKMDFNLRYMPQTDKAALSAIVRKIGMRQPVFVSMYPNETDEVFQAGNIFGRFESLSPFEHSLTNVYDTSITIEEI